MTRYGYTLFGLTAVVAMMVGVLTFVVLRFASGAREATRQIRGTGSETMLLSVALQEAVARLKAQEKVLSARAAASEQLSHQIVASLTAGFLLVDAAGRVEILNPSGRRLLGIEGDPVGADYRVLLGASAPLVDAIATCTRTGEPVLRRAVEMPAGTGVARLGVTVSPLGGAELSAGAICLFSDLTAVLELEEQLRLKETFARLGELTAGIAHEFRNGLATIHGYSRLMEPEALPAQYRPCLEGIRQETDALGTVVTNFLAFARPDEVVFVPVPLEAVARRASDDLRRDLPAGGRITVAGAFGSIPGDEVLLRRLFDNLIRNAMEACAEQGVVPAIVIEGRLEADRHACAVMVHDNGPGIPAQSREQAFQPFFTTRSRGTGLGLAIVQKIVLTHNGRVSVGESPDGGASIRLSFSLA